MHLCVGQFDLVLALLSFVAACHSAAGTFGLRL